MFELRKDYQYLFLLYNIIVCVCMYDIIIIIIIREFQPSRLLFRFKIS